MIPGSGPGRGIPWWRSGRLTTMRYAVGLQSEPITTRPREGRTVAVIKP